jgi:predicted MPP superfamily phosphohydrolase
MIWIMIPVIAAAALLIWMATEAFRVRVRREEIAFARLPASFEGTRIFFISDLHRRTLPDGLIAEVEAAGGADVVLLGGDIREKGVPLKRTRSNMRKLLAIAPVYAVYGNHDFGDSRELDVMLHEEGVHVLVNESVFLEQRDGSAIRLAGVDDPKYGKVDLERTFAFAPDTHPAAGRSEELFTILLAHDPIIARSRERLEQADLILSGHTHGGQIVLPLCGPVYRSDSVNGFRRGWFDLDQHKTTGGRIPRLFVSCGFGTSQIPLRLGAPAESHLIILRSARPQEAQSLTDR